MKLYGNLCEVEEGIQHMNTTIVLNNIVEYIVEGKGDYV